MMSYLKTLAEQTPIPQSYNAFKERPGFLVWDELCGHVRDDDGVVHRLVRVMVANFDRTDPRIGNYNVNPCTRGVFVALTVPVTCIACLVRPDRASFNMLELW